MTTSRTGLARRRRAAAVAVAICCMLLVMLGTVRSTVLRGDFYRGSLDEAEAYDRFYTQVLADPEFDSIVQRLVGQKDDSLVTGNLRIVIPPATLRALVTRAIDQLTGYMTAKRDEVTVEYAVAPILDNVRDLARIYLTNAIVNTPSFEADNLGEFGESVQTFVADIQAGKKPTLLPTLKLDPPMQETVLDLLSGIAVPERRESIRREMEPLVRAGDLNGTLALVGYELMDERGDIDIGFLHAAAGPDGKVDFTNSLHLAVDSAVVRALVLGRSIFGWWYPIVVAILALVVACALLVVARCTRRLGGRPLRAIGAVLVGAGLTAMFGWFAIWWFDPDPLGAMLGPDNSAMAPAVRSVLGDALRIGQRRMNVLAVSSALRISMLGLAVLLFAWAAPRVRAGWSNDRRRFIGYTAAILVVVVVAIGLQARFRRAHGIAAEVGCNGHAELCDRRYNEVTYFGSHNAMANADRRFIGAEHDLTIGDQLEQGVRALLIDAHYWETPEEMDELLAGLPVATADIIRPLLRAANQPYAGAWLCHTFCGLGAQALDEGYSEVVDFMKRHPREVVTIIMEDYVSREDIRDAARRTGLEEMVFTPDEDPNFVWPTLSEMIDADQRVVIMSEKKKKLKRPDWYRPFYMFAMETPFDVTNSRHMSCRPMRGGIGKNIFLMNNWVTRAAGSRTDAGIVNTKQFVLERARECEKKRGHRVNIVAVNFTTIGGVGEAVDALNGVGDK